MSYFSHRADLPLLQVEDRRSVERDAEQRRASPRQRTLLRGLFVTSDGSTIRMVTVRNLSDNGAKLEFSAPEDLLTSGVLLIPTRQVAYRCEAVWKDVPVVGVVFKGEVDLYRDKRLSAVLARVAP